MKILWVPQVSSLSSKNEILLNKDSNLSVLTNMINSDFVKNNEIHVAFEFSSKNCIIGDELKNNFKLYFDESRQFINAYIERFCFNAKYFMDLKANDYDIIFVNEPTKVIPLKIIFNNSKIVTYNHWLAFKNMPEISLRQFEGMKESDLCLVNSNYVIDEIDEHYNELNFNIEKLQPSVNINVIDIKKNAKLNFIYNHRLSSDKYYKKAYEYLVDLCNILESKIGINNMPIIYFTNPSGKSFKFDKEYFKEINLNTQQEYNNFLSSNEICGHINTFFESEGMWSMSTVDCAANGNICLLPYKFGYAEIFEKNYYGYCKNKKDMLEKMIEIIKDKKSIYKYDNSSVLNHTGENVGKRLNNLLNNLIK